MLKQTLLHCFRKLFFHALGANVNRNFVDKIIQLINKGG